MLSKILHKYISLLEAKPECKLTVVTFVAYFYFHCFSNFIDVIDHMVLLILISEF